MRPGKGASTRIPTACSVNTCQKEPTSRCSHKSNSTTSLGGSTSDLENPWDGKHLQNCSFRKAPSTSSNTGQLKSNPLHLYLESAHPVPCGRRIKHKPRADDAGRGLFFLFAVP